ncbi:MAG: M14 family metallopeptidase [Bacillota bacterium]|nr:M14 family metallopeptidase [Bacillota bacterium]
MWKKLLLLIILFFVTIEWIVPGILLQISQTGNDSQSKDAHYVKTYEQSRHRFLSYEAELKTHWKSVRHISNTIGKTNLSTDVLWADANQKKKNLVILTSGIHGIEGYVGSAMIDLFQKELASRLNPETTGIVYVHAVNPWGMKNFRRYNENNVDLNRNFIPDWNTFSLNSNRNYTELRSFFDSSTPMGNSTLHELGFLGSLAQVAATSGTGKIEKALLTGQYNDSKGVYYGGKKDEASTVFMKNLYEQVVGSDYQNIVHIDLHTGYGPKYQMSIFASSSEKMKQAEAEKAFNYPNVLMPDSKDFYVTSGDNTEYMYWLKKQQHVDKKIYSTTFEFGTMGNDTLSSIQSLKNTIDENRIFWNGSTSSTTKKIVQNRYLQMFYPTESKWRTKAEKDFRQAIKGILENRGVPLTN